MKQVVQKRKDIAFYIKMFPLPMHTQADKKSRAIACEKDNDKALNLLEDAYAKKPLPEPSCDGKAVDESLAAGKKINVNGTPFMVFMDGTHPASGLSAEEIINKAEKAEKK